MGFLRCPFLSPNSHRGSEAVPEIKKTESAFGMGGGVIADVLVIARYCLGGGVKGRDSGGKEIFIKLQKKQMVAMEGKVHAGRLQQEQD